MDSLTNPKIIYVYNIHNQMNLNNRKKALLICFAVSLGILAIFLLISKETEITEPPKPSVRKVDPLKPNKKGVLKLVSTDPKNGKVSVVDYAQYIKFTFNEPVDLETLVVKITPHVNTRIKAPVNKKTVWIIPDKEIWEPKVRYIIEILKAKGMEGELLEKPIKYEYLNVPPEFGDWGETESHLTN